MARKDSKDRGLFQRPAGSDVYWIRYAGPDGCEHLEHGGTKSEARTLYMRRRTEIHDGTCKSPHERRDARRKALEPPANGPSATLGDFARAWLEERTPHLTKPVQYDYKLLLNSHVLGHGIARQPIAKVNDGDIAIDPGRPLHSFLTFHRKSAMRCVLGQGRPRDRDAAERA